LTFEQTYTARSPYYTDHRVGAHRLVVAVECQIDGYRFHALLDTAADWRVLSLEIAELLGCELEPDPDAPAYSTRYGRLQGRVLRLPVVLVAQAGSLLEIDATWFISADWPGPVVLGWKGCLERLRFALDPTPGHEWFFFGATQAEEVA
jgi:hypothetical protein